MRDVPPGPSGLLNIICFACKNQCVNNCSCRKSRLKCVHYCKKCNEFLAQIHQIKSFLKMKKMRENLWICLVKIIGDSVIGCFGLLGLISENDFI